MTIKDWKNLLEAAASSEILNEAFDYNGMFNTFITFYSESLESQDFTDDHKKNMVNDISNEIKKEINWAKQILKKNDRIIWFLRLFRLLTFAEYYNSIERTKNINLFEKYKKYYYGLISEWNKKSETNINHQMCLSLSIVRLKQNIYHYLSYNIPEIQNYVFAWQWTGKVWDDLTKFEEEYKEKRQSLIKFNDNDDIIIDFKDGYYWVNLNVASCRKEGDAMGHCGNTAAAKLDDTILSLRKKVKIGSEEFWEPHLTFILHEDGLLGEMKGRNNEKPTKKYHPYIIKLLENDIIQGIVGGGYMPENNFSIFDLDEDESMRLLGEKPLLVGSLSGMYNYYQRKGISDSDMMEIPSFDAKLESFLDMCNGRYEYFNNGKIVLDTYDSISRFLNAEDIIDDEEIFSPENIFNKMIESMSEDQFNKFINYLKENNPKEWIEFSKRFMSHENAINYYDEIYDFFIKYDEKIEKFESFMEQYVDKEDTIFNMVKERGYSESGLIAVYAETNEKNKVYVYMLLRDIMYELDQYHDEMSEEDGINLNYTFRPNEDDIETDDEKIDVLNDEKIEELKNAFVLSLENKSEDQPDLFDSKKYIGSLLNELYIMRKK